MCCPIVCVECMSLTLVMLAIVLTSPAMYYSKTTKLEMHKSVKCLTTAAEIISLLLQPIVLPSQHLFLYDIPYRNTLHCSQCISCFIHCLCSTVQTSCPYSASSKIGCVQSSHAIYLLRHLPVLATLMSHKNCCWC